jgi:hypothetical protein
LVTSVEPSQAAIVPVVKLNFSTTAEEQYQNEADIDQEPFHFLTPFQDESSISGLT